MWKGAFYGGVYGHTIESTIPSWVPLSSNVAIETRLPSSAILRALSEASGPIPPKKKTPKWSHILRNPLLNYGFLGVFDARAVRRMGPQYMSSELRKTSFCPLKFHPWLLQSPACYGAKLGAQKKMHGWTLEMNSTDLALDGWFPGFHSQISCLGIQVFFRWDPKIGAYSQDFDSVFPSFLGSTLKKKQFWSPDVHSAAQTSCFGSTPKISWDLLQGPRKNKNTSYVPKRFPKSSIFPLGKCPKKHHRLSKYVSDTPNTDSYGDSFSLFFGVLPTFTSFWGLQNGIPAVITSGSARSSGSLPAPRRRSVRRIGATSAPPRRSSPRRRMFCCAAKQQWWKFGGSAVQRTTKKREVNQQKWGTRVDLGLQELT
jgi:hypothetical protein